MSKRKPHNLKARIARSCRSLLATNHVAVVNIDPSGRQGLINWMNCKSIPLDSASLTRFATSPTAGPST